MQILDSLFRFQSELVELVARLVDVDSQDLREEKARLQLLVPSMRLEAGEDTAELHWAKVVPAEVHTILPGILFLVEQLFLQVIVQVRQLLVAQQLLVVRALCLVDAHL
jgi:hypothetical protein